MVCLDGLGNMPRAGRSLLAEDESPMWQVGFLFGLFSGLAETFVDLPRAPT